MSEQLASRAVGRSRSTIGACRLAAPGDPDAPLRAWLRPTPLGIVVMVSACVVVARFDERWEAATKKVHGCGERRACRCGSPVHASGPRILGSRRSMRCPEGVGRHFGGGHRFALAGERFVGLVAPRGRHHNTGDD